MAKRGIIYLVGAGPGDPGLITVKGVECLKKADVVVYDYLANPVLLDSAPVKSKKIYVGKRGATHSREQEEINALLIAEAKRGRTVVRLKGGDPFVFGRGGEEAEALVEAGIAYEVVPGVTSAIAVPAYAGIPITHRDFSSTVAFVTGHEKDEEGASPPDWKVLSKVGSLVFLMAYANLPHIVEKLREAGLSAETPAAVIQWGTTPRQKTASGTLETIVAAMTEAGIRPPTIVVIGRVAALRGKIDWFETKPLFGKRILVTRSREQASDLALRLTDLGAEAVEMPTIEIRPPSHWRGMDRAIGNLSRYDWILFTSANGVRFFFERLRKRKKDVRALEGARIACVGPATARAVEGQGLRVDAVAKEFRSEGLLRVLKGKGLKRRRVLFCRAQEGREILIDGLKSLGARVDLVEAYRNAVPRSALVPLDNMDLVTFASSATAENFAKLSGRRDIPAACIGPVTAKTARSLGFNVVVQAKSASMGSLVEAIRNYFTERGGALPGPSFRAGRT